MAPSKPETGKNYFTAAQANATLPLVRAIVRDITALARDVRERHDRLARVRAKHEHGHLGDAYQEELQQAEAELERDQERMHEYAQELRDLGVDQFAIYLQHDGKDSTLQAYGERIIPALAATKLAKQ
jgi:uncharacterized protein YukE